MKIIDISVPIAEKMPVWSKSIRPDFKLVSGFAKGDLWTETEVNMNLHTGTHIDSPLHCIKGGITLDKLAIETMMGPVLVAFLPKVKIITAGDLEKIHLSKSTSRLLFKTSNSDFWAKKKLVFQKKFVALAPNAAQWLVDHKIKLVGNDYLSIAPFGRTYETHQILLKNKVIVLEGLNLSAVKPGIYQLICLPIKIIGTEASPARAVLIKL
ncbi:MAG: cyclase family protein [Candidatus Nealsonbacteria bacterium]|nr:cyclase family protein [Candidatus Nealsonbacteria bacterium]